MLGYLLLIETEQDKLKFTVLYEQYRITMFHTANYILNNRQLAEDAVHDAFLKIINVLDKVNDPSCSKTKSLIVIITKHKAIDILRKEKGLLSDPLEDVEYTLKSDIPDPLDVVMSEEGYALLIKSIDKVPDIYKTALDLKYFHHYSDDEIAQLMDITPKNANVRVYRAKVLLKEILIKGGFEND